MTHHIIHSAPSQALNGQTSPARLPPNFAVLPSKTLSALPDCVCIVEFPQTAIAPVVMHACMHARMPHAADITCRKRHVPRFTEENQKMFEAHAFAVKKPA